MSNSDHHIALTVTADGSYSYSGGNDGGKGDVVNKVGKGPANMHISLEAPSGFKITNVDLSGPGISWKIQGDKKVKVDNDCKNPLNVKYSIIVFNPTTGDDIFCDPRVINN